MNNIPSELRPPLILIEKGFSKKRLVNFLEMIDLDKAANSFILEVLLNVSGDLADDLYLSTVDIEEDLKKSRTWKRKACQKLESVGVFEKNEYQHKTETQARKATYYRLSTPSEIPKPTEELESFEARIASVEPEQLGLFFEGSKKYIKNRPSTFFSMIRTLTSILPSSTRPGSSYSTQMESNGISTKIEVVGQAGENVANDSDIRILIVLCTYVENMILKAYDEGQEPSLDMISVKVVDIAQMLYSGDDFKYGGGYNGPVMDAMKRLSWTRIQPTKVTDSTSQQFADKFGNTLRDEPYIQALTLAEPYFTETERAQRIRFALHPRILEILKEGVRFARGTGTKGSVTSLISNKVVSQPDKEIFRLTVFLYSKLEQELKSAGGKSSKVTWQELYEDRGHWKSFVKYESSIREKISNIGVKVAEDTFDLDGLRIKMTSSYLLFESQESLVPTIDKMLPEEVFIEQPKKKFLGG